MGQDVKKFYRPRIQIPVDVMLNEPGAYALYCLPLDGVSALSRLIGYAKRQITFVADVLDDRHYKTPSDDVMLQILEVIEETEVRLMEGCGIESLTSAIEAQTSVLESMSMCICDLSAITQKMSSTMPDLSGYVDQALVTYVSPDGSDIVPAAPGTDAILCEYAQSVWFWVFQTYTETLLPYADTTSDALTSAIVATASFAGLATFIGIPVAILTSIVAVAINWAIEGSIANFSNWLWSTKDEIICIYYNTFDDFNAASSEVNAFIDSQGDISYLDKQMAKLLFGSVWHMGWIIEDQITNDTWREYFTSGQCDSCIAPVPPGCISVVPCVEADWASTICRDGYPTIAGATLRHDAGTLETTQGQNWFVMEWIPFILGGGSGTARVSVDLYAPFNGNRINIGNTGDQPTDVLIRQVFQFTAPYYGIIYVPWITAQGNNIKFVSYCLYDHDPDA